MKTIRLSQKELLRASSDGYVIVVRPSAEGGFNVFAVDVESCQIFGWYNEGVPANLVGATVTDVGRDMNKFLGIGGAMAESARHRPGYKNPENKKTPRGEIVKRRYFVEDGTFKIIR